MSTSRFGTSVLFGSWRSMAPKDFSISASWARYASRFAARRALVSSVSDELAFLGARLQQQRTLLLPDEPVIAAERREQEQRARPCRGGRRAASDPGHSDRACGAARGRPAVVSFRGHLSQAAAPSSGVAWLRWFANSVNSEPPPALSAAAGLHDLQRRVGQPLRGVDVAHEGRDARARLGDAAQFEALCRSASGR